MEIYDPATEEWRATGRVRQKRRYSHTTTTLKRWPGMVLCVCPADDSLLEEVEMSDPATNCVGAARQNSLGATSGPYGYAPP